MKPHSCHPNDSCTCYILGDEPDEYCPIHSGYTDNKCSECGRFLKREEPGIPNLLKGSPFNIRFYKE